MASLYPDAVDTPTQLPININDNTSNETTHSQNHVTANSAILALENRVGVTGATASLAVLTADSPPSFKGQLFGRGLDSNYSVPYAADYTTAAIAGSLNTVASLSGLSEKTIGSQLTGLTTGQKVRLTPGIYREAPTISTANVTIYAQCDVSFRCSDNWTAGGGGQSGVTCTWSAAPAPNAANGIVSSLTVPAMSADSGGGPTLTSAKGTTTALAGTGSVMTYTIANTADPLIVAGMRVTVSGATPSGFNGTNLLVASANSTSFTVAGSATGPQTVAGTVTITGPSSGATYAFLAANREMVFVDNVAYNRVPDGSTLAAGQWMFDASRHVILYLAGGAGTHLIEVCTRELWMTPSATGIHLEGIDFRHAPTGLNAQWAIDHNNFSDVSYKNCMFGQCHGQAMSCGNATGIQVLESVFHNCESGVIGYNSPGVFFRGNVLFNVAGCQNTYAGFLSPSGYDETWGSGGIKMSGTDGGVYDHNFCFNSGFSALWHDIECRYDVIVNNVIWDMKNYGIHYEISKYGKIAGNVIFWTPACRFYTQTAGIGIYSSTSRGVDIGADAGSGVLEGNIMMHLPIGFKGTWDGTRNGVSDVQTISTTAAGNTFKFTFQGQQTASTLLASTATAAVVQAALQGLSTIGLDSVVCTGGPLSTTAVVCTFAGRLAAGAMSVITAQTVSGGSPTIAHTITGTGDAPLGGFTDCVFHNNIIIASATLNGPFGNPQMLWQWTDSGGTSGQFVPAVGTGRGPYGNSNAYFFEGAREEDITNHNIIWTNQLMWHSSVATNQDGGGGFWNTFAAMAASRWERGPQGPTLPTPAGTIAVTALSTTVTGTSTTFLTSLQVGDWVKITSQGDNSWSQVASITSNTALVLSAGGYNGATSATAAWSISRPVPLQPVTRMLTPPEAALYLGRYGLVKGS